jgi:hypothetical protein
MGGYRARPWVLPGEMTTPAATSFTIQDGLADWSIKRLITEGVTIIVECQDCPYQVAWSPAFMKARFSLPPHQTLAGIAGRARCSQCGSQRVRLWRAAQTRPRGQPARSWRYVQRIPTQAELRR